MKLSIAMMLGRVTCKMKAGDWNTCALGAAGNAVGVPNFVKTPEWPAPDDLRPHLLFAKWPWLLSEAPQPFERFFYCGAPYYEGLGSAWYGRITRRFDHEVCTGQMTFEQLADYVTSIEPECGECNKFVCSCVKAGENVGWVVEGPAVLVGYKEKETW